MAATLPRPSEIHTLQSDVAQPPNPRWTITHSIESEVALLRQRPEELGSSEKKEMDQIRQTLEAYLEMVSPASMFVLTF